MTPPCRVADCADGLVVGRTVQGIASGLPTIPQMFVWFTPASSAGLALLANRVRVDIIGLQQR